MLRVVQQTNIKQIFLSGIQAVRPDILIQRQLKYDITSSIMVVNQRSYYLKRYNNIIVFKIDVYTFT